MDGWLGVESVIRARGVSVDADVVGKDDVGGARAHSLSVEESISSVARRTRATDLDFCCGA